MRRRHLLFALGISSFFAGRVKTAVMKGASAGLASSRASAASLTAQPGMETSTARAHAFSIFWSAVRRVDPENLVSDAIQVGSREGGAEGSRAVQIAGERFDLEGDGGVRMLAFGKASLRMAKGAESKLGDFGGGGVLKKGIVIAQNSEEAERLANEGTLSSYIFTGALGNMPDSDSAAAAAKGMELAREGTDKDLLLVLISGGGSALFPLPAPGITLEEKIATIKALVKTGASINELNTVRKHLSACKGGQLGAASRSPVVALVLSDVIGDRLETIASGPTVPDSSTFADALDVLKRADPSDIPPSVMARIQDGVAGKIPETPKKLDSGGASRTHIVGSNGIACEAAIQKAIELGYDAHVHTLGLSGDVSDAVDAVCAMIREGDAAGRKPSCIILAGETTVQGAGSVSGIGGRCTHMALCVANKMQGVGGWVLLSGGTDGQDGPTDAAGAVADGQTAERGRGVGVDGEKFVADFDSYTFFEREGGILRTGLTGTNVMDIHVLLRF